MLHCYHFIVTKDSQYTCTGRIMVTDNKNLSCRIERPRDAHVVENFLNHSRSLKVIENCTIRWIAYEFLLTFHSNYGPILYRFRKKRKLIENLDFSYPPAFDVAV